MNYTDNQIKQGLTPKDIKTTLKVLRHINYRSAHGHNPKYCASSSNLIDLLDPQKESQITKEDRDEARKAMINYCMNQVKQLEQLRNTGNKQ